MLNNGSFFGAKQLYKQFVCLYPFLVCCYPVIYNFTHSFKFGIICAIHTSHPSRLLQYDHNE